MELRQLRYFVRVVEQGSMSRAALDLDVVQSALSQQITRLESELATRLLQRWAPPHHGSLPGRLQALLVRERLQACADGRSPTSWSRLTLPWRCRVIARS